MNSKLLTDYYSLKSYSWCEQSTLWVYFFSQICYHNISFRVFAAVLSRLEVLLLLNYSFTFDQTGFTETDPQTKLTSITSFEGSLFMDKLKAHLHKATQHHIGTKIIAILITTRLVWKLSWIFQQKGLEVFFWGGFKWGFMLMTSHKCGLI